MSGDQRDRARRLSEFVDSLLVPPRYDDRGSEFPADDRESRELRRLARTLAGITIAPPGTFQQDLARRLPALAAESSLRSRWRQACGRVVGSLFAPKRLSPALSAAVLLTVAVIVIRAVFDVPVASASEILSRSDAALARLVRPGQLLYRCWRVTSTTTDPSGVQRHGRVRTIREWMDGNDFDRVAGRWSSADDRLLIGYTSIGRDGERRPNAYFSPGVFGEARGLFSIEPTADEFKQAVRKFPAPAQRELDVYLHRQYIYLPIAGERTFNRAVVEASREAESELARVVLSFDRSEVDGTPVYRVRIVDPASIDFNWRSEGPPHVRLARAETVRYIARDSYLSVRSEETLKFEDGRERFTVRQLVEMRAVAAADMSLDPFKLEVPEGTPVQRQSAFEQLSGVAQAFRRLPQFARSLGQPSTTH
jgi:hypothetical protein